MSNARVPSTARTSLLLAAILTALIGPASAAPSPAALVNATDGYFTGKVGIGVSSPTHQLEVAGPVRAAGYLNKSDRRLKSNITPLAGDLDKLNTIIPATFRFTADPSKTVHLGVLAQDVEKVYPQAVTTDPNGFKSVDYPALIAPLISAIKELKTANDRLQAQVQDLTARVPAAPAK